jgi:transcription factor CP2-like protein
VPQEGSPAPSFPVNHHDTSLFLASLKERETKRTIGNILSQAKEDLDHLEVGAPAKKAALVPDRPVITVYVRKEEEKVYNALLLDSLTVHDFKLQIARTYDVPPEMIKNVFKKTKKGLLVHFNAEMISRLEDESDFIIDLPFDNQKGVFDLHIRY